MEKVTNINLEPGWKKLLEPEFKKPYMVELKSFLKAELASKKVIFPKGREYFAAFNSTPFSEVKVVILGQDPYHGPGQAHGLSFSVPPKMKIPPSLVNIYKELKTDVGISPPEHGNLEVWAKQGVLLLNATLTVEAHQAGSHQKKGWEEFTDSAIQALNANRVGLVFMLWGSYAQQKGSFIDTSRHLVLKAPHPSPLSAHRGFLGCRHFSKANQYLVSKGEEPIEWSIPPLS